MASFNWLTYGRTGAAQFTAEQGDCTETFGYEPDDDDPTGVTPESLQARVREVLGYTAPYGDGSAEAGPSSGRMKRQLPLAHPVYTRLFAYAATVTPVEGDFIDIVSGPNPEAPSAPTPASHALWEAYDFQVKFSQRPYALLADDEVEPGEAVWWLGTDGDVAGALAGSDHPFIYHREWDRFVETETTARQDVLRWKRGQMVLEHPTKGPLVYSALPNFLMPNRNLKVYWYGVPYRYIRSPNSYIVRFLGHVNQLEIDIDGVEYDRGQLLYTNYTYAKHTHPVAGLDSGWPVVPSGEKTVNLVMEFIHTTRKNATTGFTPSNNNWVVGGHNCMPWFSDRKYYYARLVPEEPHKDDPARWTPQYLSFPMQLLFKDPDSGLMV